MPNVSTSWAKVSPQKLWPILVNFVLIQIEEFLHCEFFLFVSGVHELGEVQSVDVFEGHISVHI